MNSKRRNVSSRKPPTSRNHARQARPHLIALGAVVLAALAMVLVAGMSCVRSCGRDGASVDDALRTQPYVSPYDWSQIAWEGASGDRAVLYRGGAIISDTGIDVSEFNGNINWDAVAADGVSFAFVRVGNRGYTEGALSADARYEQNLDGAAAAGLQVGAYFFSQATTIEEAREEADFLVQLLNSRTLDLPVAFDHETIVGAGRANDVNGDTLVAIAEAFCERVEKAGYHTLIYGNAHDMQRLGYGLGGAAGGREVLQGRPTWFAEYGVAQPTARFDFTIWQYSNTGTVAGIDTAVDMNLRLLQ
ncbi:glycoside hydrolase family 25 protein [Adlercreutzia sp. ZJ141]|uniref:glycoside hydrolase family 25 protein n=1 Tax=Adlercreutzia sp. ZJ141 TaxID=2709406 RepID=UPI0013ED3EE1|nr:glycoside hydrolase family 25 protein [Adlercreutzia sp. ZJ141]